MVIRAGLLPLQNVKKIIRFTSQEGTGTNISVDYTVSNVIRVKIKETTNNTTDSSDYTMKGTFTQYLFDGPHAISDTSSHYKISDRIYRRFAESTFTHDKSINTEPDRIINYLSDFTITGDVFRFKLGTHIISTNKERTKTKDTISIRTRKRITFSRIEKTNTTKDKYTNSFKDLISSFNTDYTIAKDFRGTTVPAPGYPGKTLTYIILYDKEPTLDYCSSEQTPSINEIGAEPVNTYSYLRVQTSIVAKKYVSETVNITDINTATLISAIVPIYLTGTTTTTATGSYTIFTDFSTVYLGQTSSVVTIYNSSGSASQAIIIPDKIMNIQNGINDTYLTDDIILVINNTMGDTFLTDRVVRIS
jgi:hypothetical protein